MLAASPVILGSALVILSEGEAPPWPPECPATSMVAEARAAVPVSGDNEPLRTRLDEVGKEAEAAERASQRRERQWHCKRALLAFADLAPEALGRERGETEATRARRLAVELSLAIGSYTGPRASPPPLTPDQQWNRRRRLLIGYTAASGLFTGIGMLLVTVPWVSLAVCGYRRSFCGEGYGAMTLSGIGAAVFVSSVIPLWIWSHRLLAHLDARPPGMAILHGRARVQFAGPGLRLHF